MAEQDQENPNKAFIDWVDLEMWKVHIKTDWELARRGGFNSGSLTNARKGRGIGLDLAVAIAKGLKADPIVALKKAGLLPADVTEDDIINRVATVMRAWSKSEREAWAQRTFERDAALEQERKERPPKVSGRSGSSGKQSALPGWG